MRRATLGGFAEHVFYLVHAESYGAWGRRLFLGIVVFKDGIVVVYPFEVVVAYPSQVQGRRSHAEQPVLGDSKGNNPVFVRDISPVHGECQVDIAGILLGPCPACAVGTALGRMA